MSPPAIRLDNQAQLASGAVEDARRVPQSGEVHVASDDDVLKAMKRVTRDHEELIKALAK